MTVATDRSAILVEIDTLWKQICVLRRRVADEAVLEELPPGTIQVLFCRVGDACTAFLQDAVQEVVMMCALTSIPERAFWVAGLLNLRGAAVPVIDVLARMSGVARRPELTDFIVICRVRERLVGLIVQEILDIHSLQRDDVQSAGSNIEYAPYLIGILYRDERPILLVSLARLLAVSDLPTEDES